MNKFTTIYDVAYLDRIKRVIGMDPSVYNIINLYMGTDDPMMVPTEGGPGSLYFRTSPSTFTIYIKKDAGITTNWLPLASSGGGGSFLGTQWVTDQIVLTDSDIVNRSVALSETPISQPLLYPDGGIPQFYGSDFVADGNILSWGGLGLEEVLEAGDKITVSYMRVGDGVVTSEWVTDQIVLSPQDVSNKYFSLSSVPISQPLLYPEGGILQFYSSDFIVNGEHVEWGGLGLDGVLEPGDRLMVSYLKAAG